MAKSKFFRIAVAGFTAYDGRPIQAEILQAMADAYVPATYTAGINCEHIKGFSPEPPFNSYGTVAALKTETVDIEIDRKMEKRLGLFASLDPNDQLLAINRKGQKLFSSMEIAPNFSKTGKPYLVGLAVTDNPASLGTEALSFSALADQWKKRKLDPDNVFTSAEPAEIVMDAADENAGLIGAMTKLFDGFAAKFKVEPEVKKTEVPLKPVNDNAFDPAAFAAELGKTMTTAIGTFATAQDHKIARIGADLAALTTKLSATEQPGQQRQRATGGDGAILTDC